MPSCIICGDEISSGKLCDSNECQDFINSCIRSPKFFFKNVLIIKWKGGEPVYFEPQQWQEDALDYVEWCVNHWRCPDCETVNEVENEMCTVCSRNNTGRPIPIRICVLKGRRVGFSVLASGLMIWYCLMRTIGEGESKAWDIISASHLQATELFKAGADMVRYQKLLYNSLRMESNGMVSLGKSSLVFRSPDGKLEGRITALASGGATKRGRSPAGQVFDEAAQIDDSDFNDLDISSIASDDHQIIGSTPYEADGFFWQIITGNTGKEAYKGYKVFNVPLIELTPEGRQLVMDGRHYDLLESHITIVRGYHITKHDIIERAQKYNNVTFIREILGEFVSGEELFYPRELVHSCVIPDTTIDINSNFRLKGYDVIYIGGDMAKAVDKTAIIVFGQRPDSRLDPLYKTSWRKMDYEDQYDEIAYIYRRFAATGVPVELGIDSTGTQDSNIDAMKRRVSMCYGVDFNEKNKQSMADKLFYLMRKKLISIPDDKGILMELMDVTVNLKGKKTNHLGDWVAAIWCAISRVQVITEAEVVCYDGEKKRGGGFYEDTGVRSTEMSEFFSGIGKSSNLKW